MNGWASCKTNRENHSRRNTDERRDEPELITKRSDIGDISQKCVAIAGRDII